VKMLSYTKNLFEKIKGKIQSSFNDDILKKLAKETKFNQRAGGKIKGPDFIKAMVLEAGQNPEISYEGLCDQLQEINPQTDVTPQALCEKVNSESTVNYLQSTLQHVLLEHQNNILSNDSDLLSHFNRVLIQDSTQGALHQKLAKHFKGSGGSASKSYFKLDVIYDFKNQIFINFLLNPGIIADQTTGHCIENIIQQNDLVVRDLGYLVLSSLKKFKIQMLIF
jgi:hypothetical protein